MIPTAAIEWLNQNNFGEIVNIDPISTGNSVIQRLSTTANKTFFLKQYPYAPKTTASTEAYGLNTLRNTNTIQVPQPYYWEKDFLLLEDIKKGEPKRNFAEIFGRKLAMLHKTTNDKFGFNHDNYIGATPQINTWQANGHTFFRKHRLQPQFEMANQKNYLNSDDQARFEKILNKLKQFIPIQPASLIHGDLWNGNVLANENGDPVIIDPATHYGWAEAELAMTIMFGGFGDEFFSAYQEINLLHEGWQNRFPLYNLYHYLNHLNIFGTSYLNSIRSILRKYS